MAKMVNLGNVAIMADFAKMAKMLTKAEIFKLAETTEWGIWRKWPDG